MSNATPLPTAATGGTDPQANPFAADPRVYFDKEAKTWRFEDDGVEMEYDTAKATWVPVVDEELVKAQQAAYSVEGVDEEAPAAPVAKRTNKKRKAEVDYTSNTPDASSQQAGPSTKRGKKNNDSTPDAPPRKSKNTAVYVTHLPQDATHDELVARFSKCGVLEEDEEGQPKVKMYASDDGSFSGEALVVYFKEESVFLALNILDDGELRIGEPETRMRVQQADFGHKEGNKGSGAPGGGGGAPRKTIDRKKATRRIVNMQKKLEDWADGDEFGPSPDPVDDSKLANKNSRVVVLKHMFTLDDLEKDKTLLIDLKEDVREECSTLGEVTNVVLYDKEPEGVMTVKFRDPISAQACLIRMNGRFFDGRRVEAALYSGRERFNRSGGGDDVVEESNDEAEKQRLADFTKWLLTEGD